jgi:hypothetical protein
MVHNLRSRARFALFALALVAVLPVVGCDQGNSTLTGKVTVGGLPVSGGTVVVMFLSNDPDTVDGWVSGDIQPDGSYSIRNLMCGTYKVWLYNPQAPLPAQIPAQYGFDQSQLTVTVTLEPTTTYYNIDLSP